MAAERFKKGALMGGAVMTAVASTLCGGFTSSAKAAPVTFAQFTENVGANNANLFNYTETGVAGSGGTSTLTAVSVPVIFTFQSIAGMPADLQGPQFGTLTLTSKTDQPTTLGFGSTVGAQYFNPQTVTDKLTLTRNTPAAEGLNTRTNLLTMNFTGELIGAFGGFTAGLTGETSLAYQVSYTSDFVDFSSSTVRDFGLSFTSWTTNSDSSGLSLDATSNFFKSATAAAAGSFDSGTTPVPVPEPTTALFAASGLGLFLLRRRSRSL